VGRELRRAHVLDLPGAGSQRGGECSEVALLSRVVQNLKVSATRTEWFASLDSTNDEAMRRARAGEPGPLWIAAREQTRGRGRQGRAWVSPQGNLAASLLLIDPAPVALAPQLGFVAGVALARTVRGLGLAASRAELKWPNDLVVEGAKLSGLLLEAAQMGDGRLACVIGFGVNVVAHPDGLPYPATSLAQMGVEISAEALLASLAENMALWLDRWQGGLEFERIRAAWLEHAAGRDKNIRIVSAGRELEGFFRGIDATGQLMLETKNGRETVAAGDVFLPGAERTWKNG
jgi:BirA family biotin operon repressor/biotin-[acetyl-CoA-carboxylase] ligase